MLIIIIIVIMIIVIIIVMIIMITIINIMIIIIRPKKYPGHILKPCYKKKEKTCFPRLSVRKSLYCVQCIMMH